MNVKPQSNWFSDILLLTVLISVLFIIMLGSRPLNVPDEGRYCEIAREMLITHDFITPHIDGIKYFEKPPLFYWMQAGFLSLFGFNEWGCRFLDALMGLIGCIATYFTARKLFDRPTGLFSAIILSSSFLYFALARVVTLDMTVTIWLVLALYSFILAVNFQDRKYYFYLLYIFSAFAVLTKGLIGIIFPGSIIFLYLLITHQWGILKRCCLFSGTILFLLITLPWHILVQIKNPEFFKYYFIDQQFFRYFTLAEHRYEPNWFYLPILLLGLFPWTGFLWGSIKNHLKNIKNKKYIKKINHNFLYLFINIIFIFLFFSFSKSKLVPYILPCFPFISILIGSYFAEINANKNNYINYKLDILISCFISILISIGLIIGVNYLLTPDVVININQYYLTKDLSEVLIFLLVLNIIILLVAYRKKFMTGFISQIILNILFLILFNIIILNIYTDSIKPIAIEIKNLNHDNLSHIKIYNYDYYYQDLPFYLDKNIIIIDWKGELEFTSHYLKNQNKYLMISHDAFWKELNKNLNKLDSHSQEDQKIYIILPKENFSKFNKDKNFYGKNKNFNFTIIDSSKNDLLLQLEN